MGLVERLQKREHYFRNASEGEYDANLMMRARFALEAAEAMAEILDCAFEESPSAHPARKALAKFREAMK